MLNMSDLGQFINFGLSRQGQSIVPTVCRQFMRNLQTSQWRNITITLRRFDGRLSSINYCLVTKKRRMFSRNSKAKVVHPSFDTMQQSKKVVASGTEEPERNF